MTALCVLFPSVSAVEFDPTAAVAQAPAGFTLADTDGSHLDIRLNGKNVARYMYAWDVSTPERRHETYKPYLHVFDGDGERLITKGAGGSFTHHRGIFIGWNRIQFNGRSYDRWHMNQGEMVHQSFVSREAGPESAEFSARIHWNDENQEPLLIEERTLRFQRPPDAAQVPGRLLIDFTTTLTAHRGAVNLNGDPEHAGVQFRPADEVEVEKTLYHFPKENAVPQKDLDYPWVGETFTLDGVRHSVVHMNHPGNPEGTRYSAYRDYGRFGAFFVRKIPEGESLTLRYRFLILDGEMPAREVIQSAWESFAKIGSVERTGSSE